MLTHETALHEMWLKLFWELNDPQNKRCFLEIGDFFLMVAKLPMLSHAAWTEQGLNILVLRFWSVLELQFFMGHGLGIFVLWEIPTYS